MAPRTASPHAVAAVRPPMLKKGEAKRSRSADSSDPGSQQPIQLALQKRPPYYNHTSFKQFTQQDFSFSLEVSLRRNSTLHSVFTQYVSYNAMAHHPQDENRRLNLRHIIDDLQIEVSLDRPCTRTSLYTSQGARLYDGQVRYTPAGSVACVCSRPAGCF